MELSFRLEWILERGNAAIDLDPILVPLLAAIEEEGSLKSAARRLALSYRHAWGLLKKWEAGFGTPVAVLERGRGRGTRLTEFGMQLLRVHSHVQERLDHEMDRVREEANGLLSPYLNPQPMHMRMFASHGMAITCLHELLSEDPDIDVELQIQGSLDSLHGLSVGECRVAGFHLPLTPAVRNQLAPQYRRWISAAQHRLVTVAIREQGILVKAGNPRGIKSLRDLTRGSVRFINRQINSGTRTTFDELLAQAGVDPKEVNGYGNEEFTHVAVAAMIASDEADAGFGIEAAAERFQLGFVPVLREAYMLAVDRSLASALQDAIERVLRSSEFRDRVNNLAGYSAEDAGRELEFGELFGS